jgi:hypothetical protein
VVVDARRLYTDEEVLASPILNRDAPQVHRVQPLPRRARLR